MICYIFLWQVWLAHSCLPHFREDPLDSSKAAKFKLYSQDFPEGKEIKIEDELKSWPKIAHDTPLVFIIHGYSSSGEADWVASLITAKRAYDGSNIITVDWKDFQEKNYYDYRYLKNKGFKVVGKEVARFIKNLEEEQNFSASNIHLIGHSLGAHVAGHAGENLYRLGRITGLDPAGLGFIDKPTNQRLDPSDANFVDVIHTDCSDNGFFGICETSGHLDFYPEGGRAIQPGCQFNPICSHSRATYLYIASLNLLHNCRVIGVECKDMRSFSDGLCGSCGPDGSKCASLGPLAINNPTRGKNSLKLFFETGPAAPFCVFQYHVTLALDKPKAALPILNGRLGLTLIGDRALHPNTWRPYPTLFAKESNATTFNHGKEKKMIQLSVTSIEKIEKVFLEWSSAEGYLFVKNITVYLMGFVNPPFIGCPRKGFTPNFDHRFRMEITFEACDQ